MFNSAQGHIRELYWRSSSKITEPDILMVEFPNYIGECFKDNLIPFARVRDHSGKHVRWQFAINIAFAITFHRSQGKTLELIRLCLNDPDKFFGITYVGISRVREL